MHLAATLAINCNFPAESQDMQILLYYIPAFRPSLAAGSVRVVVASVCAPEFVPVPCPAQFD